MNAENFSVRKWKLKNNVRRAYNRLRYPPPLYKKVGGIDAVVNKADGTKIDLGKVSASYAKRWGVGSGQ